MFNKYFFALFLLFALPVLAIADDDGSSELNVASQDTSENVSDEGEKPDKDKLQSNGNQKKEDVPSEGQGGKGKIDNDGKTDNDVSLDHLKAMLAPAILAIRYDKDYIEDTTKDVRIKDQRLIVDSKRKGTLISGVLVFSWPIKYIFKHKTAINKGHCFRRSSLFPSENENSEEDYNHEAMNEGLLDGSLVLCSKKNLKKSGIQSSEEGIFKISSSRGALFGFNIPVFDIESGVNGLGIGLHTGYFKEYKDKTKPTRAVVLGIGKILHKDRHVLRSGYSDGSGLANGVEIADVIEKKSITGWYMLLTFNVGFF